MNISDILSNRSANTRLNVNAGASTQPSKAQSSASNSAAKVAAATSPLTKANERIQKQVDATKAQLSNLGILKSSIAGLQVRSKEISSIPADMSATDVTTLMAKFFNAFNTSVSSAHAASGVVGDLRRAVSADAEVSGAMRELGLKVAPNGTLTHDAKKFATALLKDPAAVRGAMKSIGSKVGLTADRELANGASLESKVSALNQRGTLLAAQQKAIKAYT